MAGARALRGDSRHVREDERAGDGWGAFNEAGFGPEGEPPKEARAVRVRTGGRRWPRRMLVLANLLVLCLLLLGLFAVGYVGWRFSQVKRMAVAGLVPTGTNSQSPPGANPPMTLLLVGSDTRNLGKGGNAAFGNDQQVTGQRSDTIVLARVVPATGSVALLSIPRDLLVPVPGYGTTRVNAAFSGGPNLLVRTIEQDFGIDINHFAVVNFETFIKVADAVGGVYQYFPTPARDLWSGLTVTHPGCFLLKGFQALAFVRSREYQYLLNGTWRYQLVPESDLARIQRQQAFIKLALKKVEHVALSDPFALNRVVSGLTSSVTVDSRYSVSELIHLALTLRRANGTGIPNWTYPTVNSTVVPGALDPVPSLDQKVVGEFLGYGMPKGTTSGTAATSPALQPSSVSVEVLNGSGVGGQALGVASSLRGDGFKVTATGNAANFSYGANVIEYGAGGAAAAKLLQARVGGGATLQETSSLSGDRLVLVTGRAFSGVSRSAVAAEKPPAELAFAVPPSDQSSGPVQPDSSSYYHGQYVPPGLQPGQVPQTCPE